jgi:DtxR family Mn-dependent transcriptional regulator
VGTRLDPFEPGVLPGQEACLEAIYVLTQEEPDGVVRSVRVAQYLGVSAVSVSRALTRLERSGHLAQRTPSVRLSPQGHKHAEVIVRRHRMAERWLADRLGLGLVEAHREAERLEHALSDRVVAALWEDLGHPTTCPHGNPIPGYADPPVPSITLAAAAPGTYIVDRLYEQLEGLEDLLGWVDDHHLLPGQAVTVGPSAGSDGTVTVNLPGKSPFAVEAGLAGRILLRVESPPGGQTGQRAHGAGIP